MKKAILILSLLLLSIYGMQAQEIPKNKFEVNLGLGNLMRQDLSYSPLVHKTSSLMNTQLEYKRMGKVNHQFSGRFGRFLKKTAPIYTYYWDAEKTNSKETFPHAFHFLDLNYALSMTVFENDNWELSLGGRERNRLQVADFAYGGVSFFSYYFTFGIDIMGSAAYKVNDKSTVYMNFYLPTFSYQARSPYIAQNAEYFENASSHKPLPTVVEYIKDGQFVSWNKSQIVDFDIAYEYSISDCWNLGVKYLFSANLNQDPNKLSSFENYFFLSTSYKF